MEYQIVVFQAFRKWGTRAIVISLLPRMAALGAAEILDRSANTHFTHCLNGFVHILLWDLENSLWFPALFQSFCS